MKVLQNKFVWIFLILLVLVGLGAGIFLFLNLRKEEEHYLTISKCDENYELIEGACVAVIDSSDSYFSYYCDEGQQLDNDSCISYQYSEDYDVNWYCPKGYKMMQETYPDVCYKTTVVSAKIQMYYCPYNYILKGTKCVKQVNTSSSSQKVCPGGSMYNSSTGFCHLVGVFSSCPSGYRIYAGSAGNYTCVTNPTNYYTCPNGTVNDNGVCVSTETIDASYIRGCDGIGEIDSTGTLCTKYDYEVPLYKIVCPKDYVFNEKNEICVKTIINDANKKFYCDEEYELVDNQCIKYDIKEPTFELVPEK